MINCRPVANRYSSFSLWPEVILSLGFCWTRCLGASQVQVVVCDRRRPCYSNGISEQWSDWTFPACFPHVQLCVCVCVSACRDYCCSHVGLCPTLQAVTVSRAGKKVSVGDGSGSCPLPLMWAKTMDFKTDQTDTNLWIHPNPNPFKTLW